MSKFNKPLSLDEFGKHLFSLDAGVPNKERVVISKLNDETGEYEIQENPFRISDINKSITEIWNTYGTWDKHNGLISNIFDYPDRMKTNNLDKSKEINADFEVIEEKPEQKLLTEGEKE